MTNDVLIFVLGIAGGLVVICLAVIAWFAKERVRQREKKEAEQQQRAEKKEEYNNQRLKAGVEAMREIKDDVRSISSNQVDQFSKDVDSLDHPEVIEFRELLENAADEYNCHLVAFDIDHGTVSFSFDDDRVTAVILKML